MLRIRALFTFASIAAGLACAMLSAKVNYSSELRLQTSLFGDYGLYEQNRGKTNGSEIEHEFRADFTAAQDDLYLLQLRAGRRLLDAEEFLRPPEKDVLRLHQAYLDYSLPTDHEINLRLGRQVLDYQRGILVGPDDWDMEGNSFDAALLQLDGATWDLDLLHGHLAKDHHNQVSLISLERTTPRRTINEFYLWRFGLDAEEDTLPLGAHPDIEVYNLGTRMEGKLSRPLFYHWMVNYQTGAMKMAPEKDMRSYNFVANLDYFVDHPLLRNVGIEYSHSSGDDASTPDRHETFLPPFADRHVRSGAMDWMSMMNGEVLTLYLFADPRPDLELLLEYHYFRLPSQDSAWYVADLSAAWASGGNNWPGNAPASKDVGSELDLHLTYAKNPNRSYSLGYSVFFPGDLITDWNPSSGGWGRDNSSRWAYFRATFKF